MAAGIMSTAERLARRYGIAAVYESADLLLDRAAIDAVAVLSPHHMHLSAVEAAARRRTPVLVEKAMAPTVKDAERMIEVCKQHRVALGGILQYRFTLGARRLADTVRQGSLGKIFLASVTVKLRRSPEYYRSAPWRGRRAEAGGGVLMTHAIHTLDLLVFAMGMPRWVRGARRPPHTT